jgi:hypothetical protein
MLSKRAGVDYNTFLSKKTKKNQYIRNYDGFNMSLIRLRDNTYLFCIRILGTDNAYRGAPIIPGNFSTTKKYVCHKVGEFLCARIDFGTNFFWGDWNRDFNDNTILFVGTLDPKTLKIKPNQTIKPYVLSNIKLEGLPYKYSDVRLFKSKGVIYCYDGYITSIYQINIFPTAISLKKMYTNLCKNIKTYDKNWAYLTSVKRDGTDYFMFLNWFEKDALTVSYINKNNPAECIKESLITMKGDIVTGLGNKSLPMFSFGSPAFELKSGTQWVGVGHTKVISTMNYDNPKIKDFKFLINDEIRGTSKYIKHNSYLYLTYYYILEKRGNTYHMKFSDSYLYYFPEEEYTFSINFPMGIDIREGSVYVSMGVGDFYNFIVKESLDYVKKACVHDLEHFNQTSYSFILRSYPVLTKPNTTQTKKRKTKKTL